jgi:hypothetical protein
MICGASCVLHSPKKREELIKAINSYSMQNGWSDIINFYLRIRIDGDGKLIIAKGLFRFMATFYWFEGNVLENSNSTSRILLYFNVPFFTLVVIFGPILYSILGLIYCIAVQWSLETFIAVLMPIVFLSFEILVIYFGRLKLKKMFIELLELKEEIS